MPYTVPNIFATQSGNVPASQLDNNFAALLTGLNNAYQSGLLAARPAFGSAGAYFFATDTHVLYLDIGTAWLQVTFPLSNSFRGFLAGCVLSNDGGSPNTILDVSDGVACADDKQTLINLSAITGSIAGVWVVGSGNGKLDVGAVGASTWYHVFAILRTDTGVTDILFSLNATTPTMPANYNQKRRIGSFKTDGASHILGFIQDTQNTDYFRWKASVLDVSTTNPGIAAILAPLSVPPGFPVQAIMNILCNAATSGQYIVQISDPAMPDEAPSLTLAPLGAVGVQNVAAFNNAVRVVERCDTSQRVRYRLSASAGTDAFRIATLGWYDTRGRLA